MINKMKQGYHNSSLTTKIRYSYILILIPIAFFLVFSFYHLWNGYQKYEEMIDSTVVASEFSLDFKKDFDYETYLLVVENKDVNESKLYDMLAEGNRIVERLEELTNSAENKHRLISARKYLENLETYVKRIQENLEAGNRYEDNIKIWENDVQIVTGLLRETILQYIYYEVKEIQQERENYQEFFKTMIKFSVVSFVGVVVLIIMISYYIPLSIVNPVKNLCEVTKQVSDGNLTVRAQIGEGGEISVLSDSLNVMIDKINELLEQVTQEQIRLRKAEFELLQAQINPHFLYNTLDAIVWLAESGEQQKVVNMVGSLSEFFRSSLNQGKEIVTIREELQHVRSYLEIQQVRYQDILQYDICIPLELENCQIPKITIQPLVENALYHGVKNKRGQGSIRIIGMQEGSYIVIKVEDNGIGIKKERLKQVKEKIHTKNPAGKGSFGLYNVNERIRLNFGEEYGIEIDSEYGGGTTVSIRLPFMEDEE